MQWPCAQSNFNGATNKNALVSSSEIGYVKNHRRANSAYKLLKNNSYPLQHKGSQCVKPTSLPLASFIPVLMKMYLKQCVGNVISV